MYSANTLPLGVQEQNCKNWAQVSFTGQSILLYFQRANHGVHAQDLGRSFNRVDKMNLTLIREMIVTRELSQVHALVLKRMSSGLVEGYPFGRTNQVNDHI